MSVSAALADFVATLVEPTFIVDGAGVVQWVNGSAQRQFAMAGADLIGTSLQCLTEDPEDRISDFLKLCSRRRRPVPGRLRWRTSKQTGWPNGLSGRCSGALIREGSDATALLCIRILPDSQLSVTGFEALNRKVREQKRALRALASSQAQLQFERDKAMVTLYSIGDAVITTDAGGRIERTNRIAVRLTGWSESEAIGKQVEEVFRIVQEDDREPVNESIVRRVRTDEVVDFSDSTVLISRDGAEYAIEGTAAPIGRHGCAPLGAVIVFRDVTAERLASQQLQFLARHDPLTALHNRVYFEDRLEAAFQDAACGARQHAMIYIDLDRFKLVNDTAGHHAGDQLLVSIARYFGRHVRAGDVLARLGGDEFGLLAWDIDTPSALALAEDIVSDLKRRLVEHAVQERGLGASAGVAMIDRYSHSAAEVMRKADVACYISKQAGRSTAHLYSDRDRSTMSNLSDVALVKDIRAAITENRLHLVFQPIVKVADRQISHYEVLLRMERRDGSAEPPLQVVGAAERYGSMGELDRWVIERALAELSAQHRRGNPILLAVNLSAVSIGDSDLQTFIIEALARHEVSEGSILFEMTETAAVTGVERASQFMQVLREHGCRFALDDFGTGFSSFAYLKYLPVAFLKIDGTFIRDVVNDPVDQAMVRSITKIADSMGVLTVAESVENQKTFDRLGDLGVDLAQGFHICQPLDAPCFDAAD